MLRFMFCAWSKIVNLFLILLPNNGFSYHGFSCSLDYMYFYVHPGFVKILSSGILLFIFRLLTCYLIIVTF